MRTTATERKIFTISELNSAVRSLIEAQFGQIWLTGELSNLACPSSGHLYFSLKDQRAQVRCALFRSSARHLTFTPENGQQVLLRAQVSLYEPRGDYQLIVSSMELAGDGALQQAFEQSKKRLAAEGLFDPELKQAIPPLPQRIGVITSPTGAAIRDILAVLQRRFASIPVVIYPSLVQGERAADQLVSALETANQRAECDVLIVARGGGSLEDLWPFNEERVARAIAASTIPIISGVGHEVDTTIADFVADRRAATPSAAAECAVPDQQDWLQRYQHYTQQLQRCLQHQLDQLKWRFQHAKQRLKHPEQRLAEYRQALDYAEQRLKTAMTHLLAKKQQQLQRYTGALHALSPLNVLQRGYAVVNKDQQIVKHVSEMAVNDKVQVCLQDGSLDCEVIKIHPKQDNA